MTYKIEPLSPAAGAQITGLDLRGPLDEETFAAVRRAWNKANGLLVIREQSLDAEQHLAFSRRFGPLFGEADHFQDTVQKYLLPGHPGIYRVSNKVKDGEALGRARAGTYWHSDVSFRKNPAMASLLYAIEIPPVGGDTMFASMCVAFDTLSDAMKDILMPLKAVHDFRKASSNYWHEDIEQQDLDGRNRWIHPVVITHPETGNKALFVNPGFVQGLVGFSEAESQALLNFLYAHATDSHHVYRHVWRQGDLVIWDNRCLIHYAITDYHADRYLHRTTVIADTPAQ